MEAIPGSSPGRLETLDDDELTAEVSRLGAELAAGHARLVELAAEADRRALWGGKWDARSLAEWLSLARRDGTEASRDHEFMAERMERSQRPTVRCQPAPTASTSPG